MGRPKKQLGNTRDLECAQCEKRFQEGLHATFTIKPAEVTEDFFVVYDSEIDDFDAFFCSKGCFITYLQEVLHNNVHRTS
jgi:hypothetical protein